MRRFTLSILALMLASPFAAASVGDRSHDGRRERRERMHWTETQRKLALDKAEVVERIRRERARIRLEARARMRAELRELRQERRRELEPTRRALRESLSPDQKRALEERRRTMIEERHMRRMDRARTRR
jgi:hypothetical protein